MISIRAAKLKVSPARSKKPTFRRDCIFGGYFDLTHGLTLKSRILLLFPFLYSPWMESRDFFFVTGSFEYSPDISSFFKIFFSHEIFNKVVRGSFFLRLFCCLDFGGFDTAVLLTPLDGKSASQSHWTVWLTTFVKLTWRNSRRRGFILHYFTQQFLNFLWHFF